MFNVTFNNNSAISLQSVLLVEETGGPGKNHRLVPSQTLAYNAALTSCPVIIVRLILDPSPLPFRK